MEKTYPRHRVWNAVVMMMALLALAACSKDEETATSPKCAILSFSVSDITSAVPYTSYDSNGNAYTAYLNRTIQSSQIAFNIDQLSQHIYTVDSLPNWINLTRVVPTFDSYGYVLMGDGAGNYYGITSGSDSIDFSQTVELLCVSTDGVSSKSYTVDMYKHLNNTDTLEWKATASDLSVSGQSKALPCGDKVYVFAHDEGGASVVTAASNSDATAWDTPTTIPVDCGSVVLFQGAFYGLGTDGYVYTATPDQLGGTWAKASDQRVQRLLAADAYSLYAYDGTAIIGTRTPNTWQTADDGTTTDGTTWTTQGTDNLDMLPETFANAVSYAAATNSAMQVAVMTGVSANNGSHGVVWYKVSSADTSIDQPWAYMQVTGENPYGLPRLDCLSTTRYNGALYTLGQDSGEYRYLYRSDDNGITWHALTSKYPLPADLLAANGAASIVCVGSEFWIIQENGQIWQGSIR